MISDNLMLVLLRRPACALSAEAAITTTWSHAHPLPFQGLPGNHRRPMHGLTRRPHPLSRTQNTSRSSLSSLVTGRAPQHIRRPPSIFYCVVIARSPLSVPRVLFRKWIAALDESCCRAGRQPQARSRKVADSAQVPPPPPVLRFPGDPIMLHSYPTPPLFSNDRGGGGGSMPWSEAGLVNRGTSPSPARPCAVASMG